MKSIEYKIGVSFLFILFFTITSKSQTITKNKERFKVEIKKDSPLLKAIISANYDSLLPVSKNTAEYGKLIIEL